MPNRKTRRAMRAKTRKVLKAAAAVRPPAARPVNAKPLTLTASATLTAAGDDAARPRRFSMLAYTGEPLTDQPLDAPVVVDLESIDLGTQRIPVLYDHRPQSDWVAGQSESIRVDPDGLRVEGPVYPDTLGGKEVLKLAAQGYEWQASIRARPGVLEYYPAGASFAANGRTYDGPVYFARQNALREVSFVVLGDDRKTSALVASSGGQAMPTFEEWVASLGFTEADLTDQQRAALRIQYAEKYGEEEDDEDTDVAVPPVEPVVAATPPTVAASATRRPAPATRPASRPRDIVASFRREMAAETARCAAIRRICAGAGNPTMEVQAGAARRTVSVEEHATAENWDVNRTELECLRRARPAGPMIVAGAGGGDPFQVLAAAVAVHGKMQNVEKVYPAPVLEAAHKQFKGRIGLQQLLIEAAWSNGYSNVRPNVRDAGTLKEILASGFSTLSLPNILTSNANKFLLQAFMAVEGAWRLLAARRTVSDFKAVTSYRATGDFQFEEVGADGQLKHASMGEEPYTNQARTFGKMYAVTRQDIINDDLGVFTSVPQRLGRGGGLKINDVFWTKFLNNASFFTAGNKNYFAGAATNLQASSLATALQKFRDQVDGDGKPIAVEPRFLVVPTALEVAAMELMQSGGFNTGGNSTEARVPSTNVWAGKFTPVVSAYPGNTTYTGASATSWYLLADPLDVPVIEGVFLDGREEPVVETADADFNVLGVQMRGYFDFDFALADHRGGVRSKGAA